MRRFIRFTALAGLVALTAGCAGRDVNIIPYRGDTALTPQLRIEEPFGPPFLPGPAPLVWVPGPVNPLPLARTQMDEDEDARRQREEERKREEERTKNPPKNSKCDCRIKPFKAFKRAFGL